MSEFITQRFVIYEYAAGIAERLEETRREEIMLESEKGCTIGGVFHYSDEIEPAVTAEIKINPEAISDWPDWKISSQVQQVLHFGISCTNGIIPKADDEEYVYNRHGERITRWIIEQVRGNSPIGFKVRA